MASRKDLLKAHQFTSRRLLAALVNRRPDEQDVPLKRITTGAIASVMVGVLFLGGSAIIGLITKRGSTSWRQDRTVVVDTSSGLSFAYLQGKLYPTINITSAKLATDGGTVKKVSASALRGVPRETPIGIPQAPDQLPDAKAMTGLPIRACSTAGATRADRATVLQVGRPVPDAPDANAVVRDSSGREFLLTGGLAFEVPPQGEEPLSRVLLDLGYSAPIEAGDNFIDAVPHGRPLRPLDIPGRGDTSTRSLPEAETIGSLVNVAGNVTTHYVLLRDGLSRISPLESNILAAETGLPSVEVTPSDASSRISPTQPTSGDPDLPQTLPNAQQGGQQATQSVCVTWRSADGRAQITLGQPTPAVSGRSGGQPADLVDIEPVTGAVFRQDLAANSAATLLITAGRSYPIPDDDSRAALGYAAVTPVPVSSAVIALVPQGLRPGGQLSVQQATRPAS